MKYLYFILLISLFTVQSIAQPYQQIFPNLTGQELCDSLIANYKTNTVFSYDPARDTLFSKIYIHDDSLTCVYSGYTIYLDPTQDPTTYAYQNGINTEHTYPQSKGAVGQAKSDMHHLYPTRVNVNSSRGNDPFDESPDYETDKWWRLDTFSTTIPTQFIDEYSERENDADIFEPREDHQGNVARAMFYFYTMYKHEADSLDTNFFPIQKEVLSQWHLLDPVDSLEWIRNDLIASYQGGYKNPFILDSSLVRRSYGCITSIIPDIGGVTPDRYKLNQNYPNPFNPTTRFKYSIPKLSFVTIKVFDVLSNEITILVNEEKFVGNHEVEFEANNLSSGVYFYRLQAGDFVDTKNLPAGRQGWSSFNKSTADKCC